MDAAVYRGTYAATTGASPILNTSFCRVMSRYDGGLTAFG